MADGRAGREVEARQVRDKGVGEGEDRRQLDAAELEAATGPAPLDALVAVERARVLCNVLPWATRAANERGMRWRGFSARA
jgi:hypothetical protein